MSPFILLPPVNPDPTYPQVVLADNPVSYWRMENSPSNPFTDATGNQDATSSFVNGFHQGPALVTDSTRSFRNSSSLTLNTRLSAPALAGSNLDIVGDLTIEMWMQFNSTSTYNGAFVSRYASALGGNHIALHIQCCWGGGDPDTIRVYFNNYDLTGAYASFSRNAFITEIHHYVATINSATNTWTLWVDGVVGPTGTAINANIPVSTSEFWSIGSFWNGGASINHANASMDEVAIYNKVLTPAQIAYHYSVGTSP